MRYRWASIPLTLLIATAMLSAPQGQERPDPLAPSLVQRSCPVLDLAAAKGSFRLDLEGAATGEAQVAVKKDELRIAIQAVGLPEPTTLGREYLTYVAWAVDTGGAKPLGELRPDNGKARLEIGTPRRALGLFVTAEPHFAVTRPGDSVVLTATATGKLARKVETRDGSCSLLPRGYYTFGRSTNDLELLLREDVKKTPGEILQARNALAIAKLSGADRFASDRLDEATRQLLEATELNSRGKREPAATSAAEAVRTAELARRLAVERGGEDRRLRAQLDQARRAAEEQRRAEEDARRVAEERLRAQEQARLAAEAEAQRRAEAERRLQEELQRRAETEARLEAEIAERRRQAEETTRRLEQDTARRAEELTKLAETASAVNAMTRESGTGDLAAEKTRLEAERARLEAERSAMQAQLDAQRAAMEAEREKLRADLASEFEARERASGDAAREELMQAQLEAERARIEAELAKQQATLAAERSRLEAERTGLEAERKVVAAQQAAAEARRAQQQQAEAEAQAAAAEQQPAAPSPEETAARDEERAQLEQEIAAQREALEQERAGLEAERQRMQQELSDEQSRLERERAEVVAERRRPAEPQREDPTATAASAEAARLAAESAERQRMLVEAERARLEAERQRAQAEMEIERQRAQAEMEIQRARLETERAKLDAEMKIREATLAAEYAQRQEQRQEQTAVVEAQQRMLEEQQSKLDQAAAALQASEESKRTSEAERLRLEQEYRLQQEALATERARLEAERARWEAERVAAQQEAERRAEERAREAALAQQRRAEQQRRDDQALARERLKTQLSSILNASESPRGLVVRLSDLSFDSGRHELRPEAREQLARIAGVLLSVPDLAIVVEGHTDDVGSEETNQMLSERRAAAVSTYLVQQGIVPAHVTARGYGELQPVASNQTPDGRRQNRRVELVIRGAAIGDVMEGSPVAGNAAAGSGG